MSQSQRDQEAQAVVKSTVRRLFGEDAIDRIEVFPTEDPAGEDGLSVTVYLRSAREAVSGSRRIDAIAAISEALQNLGDSRFPYVTVLAPGYQHSEDDWRVAV